MHADPVQPTWDLSMSRLVSRGDIYCRWARNHDGYRRPAHRHDGLEIVYCEHGNGTFHVAGTDYVFTQGILLVFPATLPHFPAMHRRYERWAVCFHPSFVRDSAVLAPLQAGVYHRIAGADQHRVRRIFREIECEVKNAREQADRFINLLLEQLAIIAARSGRHPRNAHHDAARGGPFSPTTSPPGLSALAAEILQYIEANLSDGRLSVEHLAETFHYAPGHIWRIIRTATGRPPVQYINARRLDAACKLLATTDRPVSVIASMTGFRSASYFSRVFRRAFGRTPSEYRTVPAAHPEK